ncbi:hypothetical protein [Arcanobacterium hippocoleae]|uniref:Uncharacterized protein n=1 Tax=Arcanobacterium hippocoleae TaxID=149017 RepID=A0ABU1T326_9ACTO|nr:hypothetical protein [Arcanobacterium hippocoleae]MDR6939709.1 hypothetical protein [Arcanobacterium hippocoleae]
MSNTADWWYKATDGKAAEKIFRAAPDPLLDVKSRFPFLNLYQAGSIFPHKRTDLATQRKTQHELASTNPSFAAAWKAHPSQYLRRARNFNSADAYTGNIFHERAASAQENLPETPEWNGEE